MPPRLQMPNYMGYAQGASQIAQGIGGGMDLAIKNAGNREQLDAAIKGLRSEYIEQAKAVGLTQEEINAGIAKIRNPTRADYSNPEPYLNQMKDVTTAIFTPLAEKKTQARGQTSQRMGQQALGMGLRTEGYTGGEQVGAAPAQAESAAPGMYRSGAPEGTQVGGFQAQQPQLGMQQVEERPDTREAATAKFAQGEEGFIPTPEEVTQFKGGLGQAVPTTGEKAAETRTSQREMEEAGRAERFTQKQRLESIKVGIQSNKYKLLKGEKEAKAAQADIEFLDELVVNQKGELEFMDKKTAGVLYDFKEQEMKDNEAALKQLLEQWKKSKDIERKKPAQAKKTTGIAKQIGRFNVRMGQ